jgi:hypothetical protein
MSATTTKRPEEIWLEYVAQLVWEKGHLDDASWDAFLRAASLGVPASIAIKEVMHRIGAAGGHVRPNKIQSQWRRAVQHVKSEPRAPGPFVAIERPAFDPEYARQIAHRVPTSVNLAWLKRRSPIPTWITPAEYLSTIFPHGDQVLIFSDWQSQGHALYENRSLKTERNALDSFIYGHQDGVWFLSNPVDGLYHDNPRQGGQSRRSQESITAFRHVVLESDCQPAERWLRILVQIKLPILSIVSSGGKSLHALARINAGSKDEWDQKVRRLMPWLVKVGADRGALTAVRLTRLAGCYRGDSLQELLYLNPRATSQPIFQRS